MLKILQVMLQQYENWELPDIQGEFRRGRGTRDQIANIHWIIEKAREIQKKHLFLLYWLCQSLWLSITRNCGKFFKRWEYQTTWPAYWDISMQVKKQHLEPDMEHWTASKLGKEYQKAVYCHPVYLTYVQSISCAKPGWWSINWTQDGWENINNLRYSDDTTLMPESEEEK